jgi:hypothetical protein
MKYAIIISLVFLYSTAYSQFHVRVECNPDNEGKVNPAAWLNNYVIAYTLNDWQTEFLVFSQATYNGFDDNGNVFHDSYYEKMTFQKMDEAISIAKNYFHDEEDVGEFESLQYKNHLELQVKYEEHNKKLCFGCNDKRSVQCEIINVR